MSEADGEEWERLAARLHEEGGIPERRAEIVALVATGHTHAETKERLGLSSRGNVGRAMVEYRQRRAEAEWLAEHAPDI
jgi:hypothetical protein